MKENVTGCFLLNTVYIKIITYYVSSKYLTVFSRLHDKTTNKQTK